MANETIIKWNKISCVCVWVCDERYSTDKLNFIVQPFGIAFPFLCVHAFAICTSYHLANALVLCWRNETNISSLIDRSYGFHHLKNVLLQIVKEWAYWKSPNKRSLYYQSKIVIKHSMSLTKMPRFIYWLPRITVDIDIFLALPKDDGMSSCHSIHCKSKWILVLWKFQNSNISRSLLMQIKHK